MRARRLVGSLLAVAMVASFGLVTGTAPRGGAQIKRSGVLPPANVPATTPQNLPKDGVVGDRVDRSSQASLPVEVLENSDPRVVGAIAKAGAAPGPKITTGPGEVAAVPLADLPVGAPGAIDLVGGQDVLPAGAAGSAGGKSRPGDASDKAAAEMEVAVKAAKERLLAAPLGLGRLGPDELTEVLMPPLPDDAKVDAKLRAKRKRFDEKTSKLVERSAVVSKFENADGSVTAVIGKAGSAGELKNAAKVVDDDAALVSDGKGRLQRSTGVVRASVPESLGDDGEVLSVGVAGARIGFGVRKPDTQKGKLSVAKSVGGDVAFAEVFGAGTSLNYSVSNGGVKEEIVLSFAPPVGEVVYRFPVNLDGFTARANASGSISFLDSVGKEQWVIPLAAAWEKPVSGRPSVYGKVGVTLEKNAVGGQDLVVRPDEAWLRDPARKYPVIVDPTITPGQGSSANAYGYVDTDYPTTHLTQCSVAGTTCLATYSATRKVYSYVRYDLSVVSGQIVNSAFLKLNVSRCAVFPATINVRPLLTPFDAATLTWPSRPAVPADFVAVPLAAPGVVSVDVSAWLAKYASGEWPSYGFRVSNSVASATGDCDLRVAGTGSSYLEVTYTAPTVGIGTNRQPSIPVLQTPESDSTVVSPVTLSATSIDADGDPIMYDFQGCKNPCATSGVTFDSGWSSSNSWVFTTPVAGESWSWRSYAYDGITPYVIPSADWNFTVGTVASRPTIWVDDATPPGAIVTGDEPWTWVTGNPPPLSGTTASQSVVGAGLHQHYFYAASTPLVIAAGDQLFSYVYIDSSNIPSEVMLQFNDGSWEHRAYWGTSNLAGWGGDGADSARRIGPIPPAGKWVKLEVPAAAVGLEGHSLNGMAFTLVGGRATWDRAGKSGPTVTAPTQTFQESWAWGTTPDYSQISTDNQPNAGVNTGTKRFVYSATDAQVAWSGPALALTRTYNSGDATVGSFGLGWSSILDTGSMLTPAKTLRSDFPMGAANTIPSLLVLTAPSPVTGQQRFPTPSTDGPSWRKMEAVGDSAAMES